jgi:hypothetical protein
MKKRIGTLVTLMVSPYVYLQGELLAYSSDQQGWVKLDNKIYFGKIL